MAGQLIKRGESKWLVRIFTGRRAGKRQYYSKMIHGNKKDAQRYLNEKLRERDLGGITKPSKQTVSEYLGHWLAHSVKNRVREKTWRDYAGLANRYLIPSIGDTRLCDLSSDDIARCYTKMIDTGLSPRSVTYTHSVIHGALEEAVAKKFIPLNPAKLVRKPRDPRREMKCFTPKEAKQFLAASEGTRLHALWTLLIATGLRPSEALALRWSDLNLASEMPAVSVQRVLSRCDNGQWSYDQPKTEKSRRTVTIPGGLVMVLLRHRATQAGEKLRKGPAYIDGDLVFANQDGGPLELRSIARKYFKPLVKLAGLAPIRLYDLRHTSATLLLASGRHPRVVSDRLGHAKTSVTMDVYSHVLPEMRQESAHDMERLLFA